MFTLMNKEPSSSWWRLSYCTSRQYVIIEKELGICIYIWVHKQLSGLVSCVTQDLLVGKASTGPLSFYGVPLYVSAGPSRVVADSNSFPNSQVVQPPLISSPTVFHLFRIAKFSLHRDKPIVCGDGDQRQQSVWI